MKSIYLQIHKSKVAALGFRYTGGIWHRLNDFGMLPYTIHKTYTQGDDICWEVWAKINEHFV